MADTFERSCEHWSEAKRREMDDFYTLASVDYRHLAEAVDWCAWLTARQREAGERSLSLLDVACGSGKFPAALVRHGGLEGAGVRPIDYSLLDPSAFSLSEARRALSPPFAAAREYRTTLQEFEAPPGGFDIVWATHALYAVPPDELDAALARFLEALGGHGFIAHACEDAHYLRFYRHFLTSFRNDRGIPYSSAEQIRDSLERLGASCETRQIDYENSAPGDSHALVEGYLQRCVFDDTISLADMLAGPVTGPYLAACRRDGQWRFGQRVMLIFVDR